MLPGVSAEKADWSSKLRVSIPVSIFGKDLIESRLIRPLFAEWGMGMPSGEIAVH